MSYQNPLRIVLRLGWSTDSNSRITFQWPWALYSKYEIPGYWTSCLCNTVLWGTSVFKLFKSDLRFETNFWFQRYWTKQMWQVGWFFFKSRNFGSVYTQRLDGAPLLFKLFKSGLRFWIQLLVSEILHFICFKYQSLFYLSNNPAQVTCLDSM